MARKKRSSNHLLSKVKKPELEVFIKNFGPISKARIKLRPLTIFIGPNNSGKSYTAMLIHSIIESARPFHSFAFSSFFHTRAFSDKTTSDQISKPKEITKFKQNIFALKSGEELEVPREIINFLCSQLIENIYSRRLRNEIVRSFASPLRQLVKIGRRSFSLNLIYNSFKTNISSTRGKLEIKECPFVDLKIIIKVNENQEFGSWNVSTESDKVVIRIGKFRGYGAEERRSQYYFDEILSLISGACAQEVLRGVNFPSHYLPAARSGILQGHKALAAGIVKKAPSVGIEKIEIPKFSGVVADFVSSVIALPQRKSPFYKLAQELEKELIRGEIIVKTLDEFLYPEIKYAFEENEIPLHRSSSTVSELAPLFLYLKYNIQKGSLLIIEEPEAHLHPKNQRILAKFIVRLIRRGVYILITTHSEYLLEQLNSFILLSRIEPSKRKEKYGYEEGDFLNPNEIGAFVFSYDERSAGNKTSSIEITKEDGISEEEFLQIHEALYDETVRLRRDLATEK